MDEEKQKKVLQKAKKAVERQRKWQKKKKDNPEQNQLHSLKKMCLHQMNKSQRNNPKKPLLETRAEINNDNQCCVCFDEYVKRDTWVQCSFEQWLHEDCVIDVIMDSHGKLKICPVCLA